MKRDGGRIKGYKRKVMESGCEVKLMDGQMRPSGHEASPRCDAVVKQLLSVLGWRLLQTEVTGLVDAQPLLDHSPTWFLVGTGT